MPRLKRRKDPSAKAVKAVASYGRPPVPEVPTDIHDLLSMVAAALNACEEFFPVRLAHGAVLTPVGYILPVYPDAGERYVVRTMALTEFPPSGSEEED